jgi:hypothetical protein
MRNDPPTPSCDSYSRLCFRPQTNPSATRPVPTNQMLAGSGTVDAGDAWLIGMGMGIGMIPLPQPVESRVSSVSNLASGATAPADTYKVSVRSTNTVSTRRSTTVSTAVTCCFRTGMRCCEVACASSREASASANIRKTLILAFSHAAAAAPAEGEDDDSGSNLRGYIVCLWQ